MPTFFAIFLGSYDTIEFTPSSKKSKLERKIKEKKIKNSGEGAALTTQHLILCAKEWQDLSFHQNPVTFTFPEISTDPNTATIYKMPD